MEGIREVAQFDVCFLALKYSLAELFVIFAFLTHFPIFVSK